MGAHVADGGAQNGKQQKGIGGQFGQLFFNENYINQTGLSGAAPLTCTARAASRARVSGNTADYPANRYVMYTRGALADSIDLIFTRYYALPAAAIADIEVFPSPGVAGDVPLE